MVAGLRNCSENALEFLEVIWEFHSHVAGPVSRSIFPWLIPLVRLIPQWSFQKPSGFSWMTSGGTFGG